MKIIYLALLATIFTLASSEVQLRHHQFPFLDNMGPLEMAQVASGDYLSLLPDSIEPIVRKILGKEKKEGVAGYLDTAKNFFGGGSNNNNNSGGFLSGLGDMFSSSSNNNNQNSGASGIFSSFTNAFGGGQQQQQKKEGGFLSNLLPF